MTTTGPAPTPLRAFVPPRAARVGADSTAGDAPASAPLPGKNKASA